MTSSNFDELVLLRQPTRNKGAIIFALFKFCARNFAPGWPRFDSGRIGIFLLLCAGYSVAQAEWTGVAIEIGDLQADWEFSEGRREAKSNSISLQIEERTRNGLAVGAEIGYHSLRLDSARGGESTKFEVQNIGIYLRQDFPLSETVALEGLLSYGYFTGDENSEEDRAEIDWNEVSFELGVAIRLGNWRITPFASYTALDGDTSGVQDGGGFELEDPINTGVRFDIFVENTAYISIKLQAGSQAGGYLSFVRRYR